MLPDTQFYCESNPTIFNAQTQWIVDNMSARNIAFVTQVGDLVQNSTVDLEWQCADGAVDRLDGDLLAQPNGLVPYSIAIGNHDFEPVDSHIAAPHFVQYFGNSRYQGRSWYGGSSTNQLNHYQLFSAEGFQFLHLMLEWEPRSSAITWAEGILATYPNVPTIISTHAYLQGGLPYDDASTNDGLSGQQLFEQVISQHPQIFMVLNGHFSGESRRISQNIVGSEIIEANVDFQNRVNGGDGWLRLIEFHPDENRIDWFTYSPTRNEFETDGDSQFSIDLDFQRRFDLQSPRAILATPNDNGSLDFDPRFGAHKTNLLQNAVDIQLFDVAPGIQDSSVTAGTLLVKKDGVGLINGVDYTFSFDAATDRIRLTPIRPSFESGKYEIILNSGPAKIQDTDGHELLATTFTLDIDTTLPSLPTQFYFAMTGISTLPGGVSVADEDIVFFDGSQFSTFFDGSDVGLSAAVIDAMAIVSPTVLLLSTRDPITLPGISETVDDSDIVKFTASQLGTTTAGTYEMYFDGSDVGLTSSSEDIDALDILADGSLVISATGSFSVAPLAAADEDLIRFVPTTLGTNTAGTYSLYFDGSNVALAPESVDGAGVYGSSDIYVTLTSDFAPGGPTIRDDDIFVVSTTALGAGTSGVISPRLFFDGSQFGLNSGDLLDFHIPIVRPPGNHAPDGRNDFLTVNDGGAATTLVGGQDNLLWNDTDIDLPSDTLSVSTTLIRAPQFGTAILNANGTFSYSHNGTDSPSDVFFYELRDANGGTDMVAVVVSVMLNEAPTLTGIPDITLPENGSNSSIDLDLYYSDAETPASQASFEILSSFTGITASIDPVSHVLTVTGNPDFSGQGDIIVRVTDTGDSGSPPLSATDTLHVTVTPPSALHLFLTVDVNFNPHGTTLANEDLIMLDGSTFSQIFDGSDVGLTSYKITDFAILNSTEALLIFSSAFTLPGTSQTVDPHDVVKFTANNWGGATSGTLEIYFDGDDVGLDTTSENLDGLERLSDGTLLLSMKSTVSVLNVSARDEDILAFSPSSLGVNTSGTWSLYFDGSDVGLSSYDIDAIAIEPSGDLLLSTDVDVAITGLNVADEDIFRFRPTSLGAITAGSFDAALVFDGSQFGLSTNEVAGVEYSSFSIGGGADGEGESQLAAADESSESRASIDVDSIEQIVRGPAKKLSRIAVDQLMAIYGAARGRPRIG